MKTIFNAISSWFSKLFVWVGIVEIVSDIEVVDYSTASNRKTSFFPIKKSAQEWVYDQVQAKNYSEPLFPGYKWKSKVMRYGIYLLKELFQPLHLRVLHLFNLVNQVPWVVVVYQDTPRQAIRIYANNIEMSYLEATKVTKKFAKVYKPGLYLPMPLTKAKELYPELFPK